MRVRVRVRVTVRVRVRVRPYISRLLLALLGVLLLERLLRVNQG